MGFVRRAIVGGQGIGFMPPLFALAAIESHSLVRILSEYLIRLNTALALIILFGER
ncbi:hypothetical protein KT99_14590 [Shewanella benthica KT99]|uniref:Uncharacterized protein n=1 Tax=Shewanella benthica KT99 TaxID=314608 RepID=A9DG55_9GAMM|nr:hypothetical protein KT99_14590 [Shewanella benthica KT99]